jgi:phage tail protein X
MIEYRVKDGDVLDWICWRHYGRQDLVPTILAANPGIEHHGGRLPAGLLVLLPAIPSSQVPVPAPRRLWD